MVLFALIALLLSIYSSRTSKKVLLVFLCFPEGLKIAFFKYASVGEIQKNVFCKALINN